MTARASGQFTILGGGLAGSLMAVYLARAGHAVSLLEKRPDPRAGTPEAGRSINLALSTRGIEALREVGILDEILTLAIPMRGRMIHPQDGPCAFQPYGTSNEEVLHSVSRLELNRRLLSIAERYDSVNLRFGVRCDAVDFNRDELIMSNASGHEERVPYTTLIGADGAFSALRAQMQKMDRYNLSQHYIEHGYKELTIPARPDGSHALEREALHIWPRGTYMMIALPNLDGSFTCTLFWPYEGANSFAALRSPTDVESFFRRTFPDAVPLMPTLVEDFLRNPVGSLVTIRCFPWHVAHKAVLIGDACHAVLPFYGQGMNAAFEDCIVLNECLAKHDDSEAAFKEFERRRKADCDVLAQLAYDNFIEMRDKVASPLFLAWKRCENFLHAVLPAVFVSLHGIVSFSRVPYRHAVARVRRQNRALALSVIIVVMLLLAVIF